MPCGVWVTGALLLRCSIAMALLRRPRRPAQRDFTGLVSPANAAAIAPVRTVISRWLRVIRNGFTDSWRWVNWAATCPRWPFGPMPGRANSNETHSRTAPSPMQRAKLRVARLGAQAYVFIRKSPAAPIQRKNISWLPIWRCKPGAAIWQ